MVFEKEYLVLKHIVQRYFGNQCNLCEYEVLLRKVDYLVVRITLVNPTERVVLKLAGPNAPILSPFDRTFAMNQQVRKQTTVPTFEALAFDMSYDIVPYRYLLMTHIDGQLWSDVKKDIDSNDSQKVYQDFGRAVAQLHSIEYRTFGEIGVQGEINTSDPSYISALSNRAEQRIRNPYHRELFVSLLYQNKCLFNDVLTPRLTHEDLNPGNILVRKRNGRWELAGIVDFDSAWAGGFESDLARLELWKGMIGEGFFEEYQTINPIPTNYTQRKLLLQLLWCLEYANPSEEHHKDTKNICDKLGIPVVTFL
ncbi:phosphotransferase [Paenibacillus qinlingensis]|uniref:Aminoglycoside phosphotransferase (APT) family kinase protein n=1 Tax=Paenibacillus qinlingensis TaxID=1837343 RepID=A0ABU1NWD8_9BACL|nr:phosphotransferase [Paenibacillus qinlingensis]MDR6551789.1 aminoglycoside phosphotransferase (APT) family kinase protein [Paenibacillus qinlingensis]